MSGGGQPEFGFFAPIVQPIARRPWEEGAGSAGFARLARSADALGYHHITVGDHSIVPADTIGRFGSARFYDPISTLGYVAAITERIRLLTYVMVLPLRAPTVLAKALATVDELSGGRLIAGVGRGSDLAEVRAGFPAGTSMEDVTDEYLEAMLALWSPGPVSFDGTTFAFDAAYSEPRPVQRPRPPVIIGGKGRRALVRAARVADGWMPSYVSPDELRTGLDGILDDPAFAVREHPHPFRAGVMLSPLGGRAPLWESPPPMDAPGSRSDDEVVAGIERWRASGATTFMVDLPAESERELDEALEWFAGVARREYGGLDGGS